MKPVTKFTRTKFPVVGHRRPDATQIALDEAAVMVESAQRPLLLIGAGANRKRIRMALTDFTQESGIPFFNTQMVKDVVDERHPLYFGTAALSDNDFLHYVIDHADLVINVGHDVVEKPPFFMHHGGKQAYMSISHQLMWMPCIFRN